MLGSQEDLMLEERVRRILAPMLQPEDPNYQRRIADVDHLLAHKKAGRDVFGTDDAGMIKKADVLQQECGLRVMFPRGVLDLVERSINTVLLAEDFQAGFGVITRLIESHLPDEPWTPPEQRAYEEHRRFLLRTFPKLYPSFNSYWAQASGEWRPAGDPFRPFYAEETGEAAVAALRRERRGGFEWQSEVAGRAAKLRTVLLELVGYIEA
jgi:hypothetical protein